MITDNKEYLNSLFNNGWGGAIWHSHAIAYNCESSQAYLTSHCQNIILDYVSMIVHYPAPNPFMCAFTTVLASNLLFLSGIVMSFNATPDLFVFPGGQLGRIVVARFWTRVGTPHAICPAQNAAPLNCFLKPNKNWFRFHIKSNTGTNKEDRLQT